MTQTKVSVGTSTAVKVAVGILFGAGLIALGYGFAPATQIQNAASPTSGSPDLTFSPKYCLAAGVDGSPTNCVSYKSSKTNPNGTVQFGILNNGTAAANFKGTLTEATIRVFDQNKMQVAEQTVPAPQEILKIGAIRSESVKLNFVMPSTAASIQVLLSNVTGDTNTGDKLATLPFPASRTAALTCLYSTAPSSASYPVGSSNVAMVGLSCTANKISDITINDVAMFLAGSQNGFTGTVNSDNVTVQNHVSSCSLYDSQSGALVAGPQAPTAAGPSALDYFNMSWTVPAGQTEKLIENCNFTNAATEGAKSDDYSAYLVDGSGMVARDSNGDIVNVKLTPTVFSLSKATAVPDIKIQSVTAGTISATLDGSSPKSSIVLGNSDNIPVSVFKFQASNENFTVTDLTLSDCVGYASNASATGSASSCANNGGKAGADQAASAVFVSYQNKSGSTETKQGVLSNGSVTFSGLDFYVMDSSTSMLTVSIDASDVGSTHTSGDQVALALVNVNQGTDFKAVGETSNALVTTFTQGTGGGIGANAFVVRKTEPSLALSGGSPSGNAFPSPSQEVLAFTMSANPDGFVNLDSLLFGVQATDNAGTKWNTAGGGTANAYLATTGNWNLYNANNLNVPIGTATFYDKTGNVDTGSTPLAYVKFSNITTEEIGAGVANTYVLKVNTTGASTGNANASADVLQVYIPSQTEASGLASPANAITWDDDIQATPSGSTANDGTNTNGAFIRNLPVNGGTLVF